MLIINSPRHILSSFQSSSQRLILLIASPRHFDRISLVSSRHSYTTEPDRPFTLPSGEYKPKQTLGQNFLSDQNIIRNIVNVFHDSSEDGIRVIELGPGSGALTRLLHQKYPKMTGIDVDKRSIQFLGKKLPNLHLIHADVLETDWVGLAVEKGGPLSLIGNLPFNISSQILFDIIDNRRAVSHALFTTQYEVARRIISPPRTKEYGILSVAFQLYSRPEYKFTIPSTAFYPAPKVESGLVYFNFKKQNPRVESIRPHQLRKSAFLSYLPSSPLIRHRVLVTSFGKRRKTLRASLKGLLLREEKTLHPKWGAKRPEEMRPEDFIDLTAELWGEVPAEDRFPAYKPLLTREDYSTKRVWRHPSKNFHSDSGDSQQEPQQDQEQEQEEGNRVSHDGVR